MKEDITFEFTGLRKNGSKDTIIVKAPTLQSAQREAKTKLKTITQTVRLAVAA